MTLNEAQKLFPSAKINSPEGSFGYIYITFEPISGKFYIGKKSSVKWIKSYYGSGSYPKKWLKEKLYLEHWPIQWCKSYDELNSAEFDWINMFKDNADITNQVEGGGDKYNGQPKTISDEYRKKVSENIKEYIKLHGHPMQGKHHTDEVKRYISEHNKEYYKTHKNPQAGVKCQEERLEQMSKIQAKIHKKERVDFSPNDNILYGCANDRVKVICVETGEIFNSIKDAGRAYGTSHPFHISDVCRGKRRTCMGYHWQYYTPPNEENSEPSSLPNYSYSNEFGFLERKTCLA